MQISFSLSWIPEERKLKQAFKNSSAGNLFFEYTKRIQKYTDCNCEARLRQGVKSPSEVLWFCDTKPKSKMLSSEDLAGQLRNILQSGMKRWRIAVGGPDGFSAEDREAFRPDTYWNFGPMTLPHELAAVVAAEQIYRAWTILKGEPYHLNH